MDLQKFIDQSLTELMHGLRDAQTSLADSHARICQQMSPGVRESGNYAGTTRIDLRPVYFIHYDVAIEVSGEEAAGGKLKVAAAAFGGVQGEASKKNADRTSSRMQFAIPICYPEKGEEGGVGPRCA